MKKICVTLDRLFPNTRTHLTYKTRWQLLVAVMLSAQCTDRKVNEVTKILFKTYPSLKDYTSLSQKKLETIIYSTGFYKTKAKNIINTAKMIKKIYGGKVPSTMKNLVSLPGVARKTGNVILSEAFGKHEGIAVDTHVRRFAIKFNLTDSKDPIQIEKDLMKLVPKKSWGKITHQFITYGREVCPARKHTCKDHPLSKIYPPAQYRFPTSQ